MKVALNASLLYDAHLRGWNRYTISLIEELKNQDLALCLYSRQPIDPTLKEKFGQKGITYREAPKKNYYLWEQFTLPKWCREDRVDIFHSPFNYGLPVNAPCKTILTVHDAIDEKYTTPALGLWDRLKPSFIKFQVLQNSAMKSADHFITVSHHARGDIKEVFEIPDDKISVTYESHPKEYEDFPYEKRPECLMKYNINFPYFFYVGGFEERKNLPFLLEAFAKANLPNHRLVIGGGGDKTEIQRQASKLGINPFVHFTGYVEESDLPALYQGADAFIYPSLYEGFGLQVCESMALGCPTLVSDRTSLPEVLGNGGLIFELDDPSPLADMMAKISQKPDLRQELSNQAKMRSKDFSWAKTAKETADIYRSLLKKI